MALAACAHMIKLTREITPYVWVHPDGDRDREGGWERDEAIVAPNSLRIVANQFSSLIRVEYLFFFDESGDPRQGHPLASQPHQKAQNKIFPRVQPAPCSVLPAGESSKGKTARKPPVRLAIMANQVW